MNFFHSFIPLFTSKVQHVRACVRACACARACVRAHACGWTIRH